MNAFASRDSLTDDELASAPLRSLPRPSLLAAPLEVKPARAARAAEALGLETAGDLLEHFPWRHEDRERRPIATLRDGDDATVIGEVRRISKRRTRTGKSLVQATVVDETGPVKATWFNQPWIADRLVAGSSVVLTGKFSRSRGLAVREYEVVSGAASAPRTTGIVPVYPATDQLPSRKLHELAREARPLIRHFAEPLPAWLRIAERLPERPAAIDAVHFPEAEEEEPEARRRLAFEELFLLELALAARKRARERGLVAAPLEPTGELVDSWLATLPFELTGDQRRARTEIDEDVRRERPMQRLLMGEVGSGKTVISLGAMLRAVENDRQAALMAPTETLAEQHMATLDRLLGGHVPIALLTGSTPTGRRREIIGRLESGELGLVVGTHALIEPAVQFRALGLVVVDEQHRFGVRQRAALEAKAPPGLVPHALHMTATPIPRTLQLTVWRDLDQTILRELPAGRRPIETYVVNGARERARAYERAREEIAAGRQAFVVCPLVAESEALQAKAATIEFERLRTTEFKNQRVELIHGQMGSRAKAEAMRAFAEGAADVLVATSVIEVGVDHPNATVMLIEAAERYGLSQLHQLRGRIGRGEHPSVCILFGDPMLPRLRALATERDGFTLAEIDLELRGHGDIFGTRQHGEPLFKVARLPEDRPLLERARLHAEALLDRDREVEEPEHALLRAAAQVLEPIPA